MAVRNKIVKKDIINKIKFPTNYPNHIVLYEDSAFTPALYSYIDKFLLCKDAYYIWDKRKQKTIWTSSTANKWESSYEVWKSFIYAYSYPIYHRNEKNKELNDYQNFKRLIQSYDKFTEKSDIYDYWNEKLKELIQKQHLEKNQLIIADSHLREIIEKLWK